VNAKDMNVWVAMDALIFAGNTQREKITLQTQGLSFGGRNTCQMQLNHKRFTLGILHNQSKSRVSLWHLGSFSRMCLRQQDW
jgi:hypothetical protein